MSTIEKLRKIKIINCSDMIKNVQEIETFEKYFMIGDWLQRNGVHYMVIHVDETGKHLLVGTQGINAPIRVGDSVTLFTNNKIGQW